MSVYTKKWAREGLWDKIDQHRQRGTHLPAPPKPAAPGTNPEPPAPTGMVALQLRAQQGVLPSPTVRQATQKSIQQNHASANANANAIADSNSSSNTNANASTKTDRRLSGGSGGSGRQGLSGGGNAAVVAGGGSGTAAAAAASSSVTAVQSLSLSPATSNRPPQPPTWIDTGKRGGPSPAAIRAAEVLSPALHCDATAAVCPRLSQHHILRRDATWR